MTTPSVSESVENYLDAAKSAAGAVKSAGGGILGGIAAVLLFAALIVVLLVIVGVCLLLFHAIGGLVVLVAWNLGVVNIVAAAGGSVATIGYLPAIGVSFAIGLVRSIFRRGSSIEAS